VGFIQKLPTQLVAAFRATLEEITDADLMLHVVDITHPNARQQYEVVVQVLAEIGAGDKPSLIALNKTDRLQDALRIDSFMVRHPQAVLISALRKTGLDELLAALDCILKQGMVPVRLRIPFNEGELLPILHSLGVVEREEAGEKHWNIEGLLPRSSVARFQRYLARATQDRRPGQPT